MKNVVSKIELFVITLNLGLVDIIESIKKIDVVLYFAWGDTKARYRRSLLGPFWLVLSSALSVAGLGFIWSMILKQSASTLVPSLTIGLVLWQFISGCIIEASSVFVRNAHFIRNIKNPYFIYPMQLVAKQLINLAHSFIIIIIVLIIYPPTINWSLFLILPGLFLVVANLMWVVLLFSMVGSRFRDVEQIIGAVMPIMFFISPVIYRPNLLDASHQLFIWLNPFSYLLSLIRDPIMGNTPSLMVYQVAIVSLVIGWVFVTYLYGRKRSSIAFWI